MHEMCKAAVAGNTALAVELNNKLMPLHEAIFIESNPIPAKWGVSQQGFIQNSLRLPLVPLSDEAQDHVRAAMIMTGVL